MIADYVRLKEESGVSLSCTKPCVVLSSGEDYRYQLKRVRDSIVFVDEGARYLDSPFFAQEAKNSDNYYVIFNREDLFNLPYSVEEIYEIKTSGKYHSLRPIYAANEKHRYANETEPVDSDLRVLLTEDSEAGYEFYCKLFATTGLTCETAGGKTKIFQWLSEHLNETTLVVADGAAFGPEMNRIMQFCKTHPGKVQVCLPESFEWLILKSGIIPTKRREIAKVLSNPSEHIESSKYFSWEQFFAAELVKRTMGSTLQYSKRRLNTAYLQGGNPRRIAMEIFESIPK